MSPEDAMKIEDAMLILFCVGFAAGAGALPYSRAEELVKALAVGPGGNG